jgi:hypothetical protein
MLWLWLCLPAAVVGASALRTWPPQLSARIPAALREQARSAKAWARRLRPGGFSITRAAVTPAEQARRAQQA